MQKHLHSTMFLLILDSEKMYEVLYENLHSTMFLLILHPGAVFQSAEPYLHSTMFLLIRCHWKETVADNIIYIPQCFY